MALAKTGPRGPDRVVTMLDQADQLSQVPQPSGRALLLRWVLAHVLILTAVLSLLFWATGSSYYGVGGLLVLPFALVAPFVAQWIGVRGLLQSRREAWLWILATVIGCFLGAALFGLIFVIAANPSLGMSALIGPVGVVAFGSALGLAQWLVLQRHVHRALWWVPANALGLALGIFVATLLPGLISPLCQSTATMTGFVPSLGPTYCSLLIVVITISLATAIFSVITGSALVWLTDQKGTVGRIISGRYVAVGILTLSLPAYSLSYSPYCNFSLRFKKVDTGPRQVLLAFRWSPPTRVGRLEIPTVVQAFSITRAEPGRRSPLHPQLRVKLCKLSLCLQQTKAGRWANIARSCIIQMAVGAKLRRLPVLARSWVCKASICSRPRKAGQ